MKRILRILLFVIMFNIVSINASEYKVKVLLIEIDPTLTKGTIGGISCRNKKASVCLNQDSTLAVNEIIEDLEYTSHNTLKIEIVKREYLNEFPKYKNKINNLTGSSYSFDEDTWLDIMKYGWINSIKDSRVISNGLYNFDYDYIINKYNLEERRNNNEFDEVWLLNSDPIYPTSIYESLIAGNNAYWMNGESIYLNCKNFKIMNISIARRDVNLESFGHATESILSNVFTTRYNSYEKDSLTNFDINDLNLWERFTLNNYASPGYASVGNMHFAPNSSDDYDWQNQSNVNSSYDEWNNYPNITGKTTYVNSSIWVPYTNNLFSAARMHHRWWFSLIPHTEGRTKDGYSNNWWEYLSTEDYVTKITSSKKIYTYNIGDKLEIEIKLHFKSNDIKEITINKLENYIQLSNLNIFEIKSDGLYALSSGTSSLKYNYDGQSININIVVHGENVTNNEKITEEKKETNVFKYLPIILFGIITIVSLILINKQNKNIV